MLPRISLILSLCAISVMSFAQTKLNIQPQPKPAPQTGKPIIQTKPAQGAQPVVTMQPQVAPKPLNYTKLNANLSYVFIVNKQTSPSPKEGDVVKLNMITISNNRFIYNSFQSNKGKPVEFSVNKSGFKGDIIEAINLMTPGDSIVCLVDADAIYKNTKNKRPDFIKSGDKIQYFIKLVGVKTKEQVQKEQQVAMQKQMKEMMAKQEKEQAKLILTQEKELKNYFTKNNLTPLKTATGLYYTLIEKTEAELPKNGDTVSMNYTGKLLDGTKFDSNEDTSFHHVTPFEFPLGAGRVIKGWDEGVALLPKGSKAVFYIPSRLAYGAQATPGSAANPKGIPANSILIFDVQLLNIKPKN
ncbi:MAG: FKBP-type peptidyl-prolyl cis-trans isomerase [Chitinophagaceae bacterium]|nr:FKBP-type peptidyl-prolyl cis-trans isomerase [Chitinophagaceae bacterium]